MTSPRLAQAVRESITIPALLLLVSAGGGFRSGLVDGAWRFLPPTPMTLVLGLLLVGVLVRTGVVDPGRLIGPHRSGLATANGAAAAALLLVASAQVFTCLTPESGLLHVLASVFFLLLVLNTLAARPTRTRALQSLGVVFLSAFVLKYVVLDALYAPEGSLARRVVTSLLEGVTLGTLGYTAHGPATAYVAFAVVLAYLFVLLVFPGLPDDPPAGGSGGPPRGQLDEGSGRTPVVIDAASDRRGVPRDRGDR